MINKDKCNAWSDFLLAIIKMTEDLNEEEFNYIEADLYKKYGEMKLNELKADYNI